MIHLFTFHLRLDLSLAEHHRRNDKTLLAKLLPLQRLGIPAGAFCWHMMDYEAAHRWRQRGTLKPTDCLGSLERLEERLRINDMILDRLVDGSSISLNIYRHCKKEIASKCQMHILLRLYSN